MFDYNIWDEIISQLLAYFPSIPSSLGLEWFLVAFFTDG